MTSSALNTNKVENEDLVAVCKFIFVHVALTEIS